MATSTDIVNQAIQLIGDNQPAVTGVAPNFDTSPAGKAAAALYTPTVNTVARQFGWDFARNTVVLTTSGNVAPYPWSFEYLYPSNGVQIWQLLPGSSSDPNNPLPVRWAVGNTLVASVQTKVIWSNLASASAYFNNIPSESTWDPLFRESVVNLLARGLALAINGKPDTALRMLESTEMFTKLGEMRDS